MNHIPKPYEIYRHFKGNLYQILAIAKDSEDGSDKVVYQALYEPFEIYVRDLAMFMSPVDKKQYPDAGQKSRFERVLSNTGDKTADNAGGNAGLKNENRTDVGIVIENQSRYEEAEREPAADGALDPFLLKFLDADTYEEKMGILRAMHGRIDQEMINTIAVSLDIEVAPGELEERYRQVFDCLATLEKYECIRLR